MFIPYWIDLCHLKLRKIFPRSTRGIANVKSSHVLPVGFFFLFYVIICTTELGLGILIRHDAMRQTLFHFACMLLQLKLALSYVTSLALAI